MARVAFLGSPEAAVTCLQALVAAGHKVSLVVTEPDRRRGRGTATSPTPVKQCAVRLGIPVSAEVGDVLAAGADLGVVVAFGRLIRPPVLERLLMVNVHFSLLPRWRGAAPVERAILAGDEGTGVSLMRLEAGLDTGPVYACAATPIDPHETALDLRRRLSALGAELLVSRLAGGVASLGIPVPQVGEPTYAAKLTAEDLHIDWSAPALQIERQVRVGRAWTVFRRHRFLVLAAEALPSSAISPSAGGRAPVPGTIVEGSVATGDDWLALGVVQAEGRQRQPAADWLRGARIEAGEGFS